MSSIYVILSLSFPPSFFNLSIKIGDRNAMSFSDCPRNCHIYQSPYKINITQSDCFFQVSKASFLVTCRLTQHMQVVDNIVFENIFFLLFPII
jgi:hypothetical protein